MDRADKSASLPLIRQPASTLRWVSVDVSDCFVGLTRA
jgi:hypothetical protein